MASKLRRIPQWFLDRSVGGLGILLLVLGLLSGILGYRARYPGRFTFGQLVENFYANVSMELVSVAFTVLIINKLYRQHEIRREKEELLFLLRSKDNGIALQALEKLRAQGALKDGTLRGTRLHEANLSEANLEGADMRGVDLGSANLASANLQDSDLHDANLQGAVLFRANLKAARLEETRLNRADLCYANLHDAHNLSPKQMIQVGRLVDATMFDGNRYDGRFNLPGDVAQARLAGFDFEDSTAMARYYEVTLDAYSRGQEWARENL